MANSVYKESLSLNYESRLQVEATLYSRPLTAALGDASHPEALTPDHILRLRKDFCLLMDDVSQGGILRRCWFHAQIWKRWRAEYFHTL